MANTLTRKAFSKSAVKQQESIYTAKLEQLDISTSEVDIDIVIHEDPRIDIMLETYDEGPELYVHHSGGQAEITVKRQRNRSFFSHRLPPCRLQITVPGVIADRWQIKVGSGDITALQLVAESLSIRSGSGDLDLAEINTKKACFITSSGDITLRDHKINDLQFETSSGDVKMETINGDMKGSTSSGTITVANLQGRDIELGTSSGDINLENILVKTALFNTSSGDVKADQFKSEQVTIKTSSGDMGIQGFLGDMKGNTGSGKVNISSISNSSLDIGTGSGDVTLVCDTVELDTTFDMQTGSGDVMMNLPIAVQTQTKKHLVGVIGEGNYLIRIKTGSGDIKLCS